MLRASKIASLGCLILLIGCSGGGSSSPSRQQQTHQVTAGTIVLDPVPATSVDPEIDFPRLGLAANDIEELYEFTTPADQPFSFHVISRSAGNSGSAMVSVAHARDGDVTPTLGVESLSEAGMLPMATGSGNRDQWLDVRGDGFSRLTIQGAIDRDQTLVFRASDGDSETYILVQVRIGVPSAINHETEFSGDYPDVVAVRTLYSSDSWSFGQPTIALSGDKLSVVVYEGDRMAPSAQARYEMRMQYDSALDDVKGGGSEDVGPDSGNWRDHEIAALYNVLAIARSGRSAVTVQLSFDRGASVAQEEVIQLPGSYAARLVQVAIAGNYDLAVTYWRPNSDGTTDLVLLEGSASTFDAGGSPTSFAFTPPEVVHHIADDVTPMVTGVEFSTGGDLVIGYSFTHFDPFIVSTEYHCAVRLHNDVFRTTLIETNVSMPMDPSVALSGEGAGLNIFYAYEMTDGIRVRHSSDAGLTFSAALVVGDQSSTLPRIFARPNGASTRVDLLYITTGLWGQELHIARWLDFFGGPQEDYQLTTSTGIPTADLPAGAPVPGAPHIPVPAFGYRITQVAWFGYDATLDESGIAVVIDEQTYDSYAICVVGTGALEFGIDGVVAAGQFGEDFTVANPPPLATGMTETLPDPDAGHMHQLRLLRLD